MIASWLKIDVDILDDDKIKLILSYPDGDKLFRIWIGFLCRAMKSKRPGFVEASKDIPFDKNDLSKLFGVDVTVMELAVKLFEKYKMIDEQNGHIYVTNFKEKQDLDRIEYIRDMDKLRKQKKRIAEKQRKIDVEASIPVLSSGHPSDIRETSIQVPEESSYKIRVDKSREAKRSLDKKRKEKKSVVVSPPSEWTILKKHYLGLYEKASPDTKPIFGAKEGKVISDLLKTYEPQIISNAMTVYFNLSGREKDFIQKNDYSLTYFTKAINPIIRGDHTPQLQMQARGIKDLDI